MVNYQQWLKEISDDTRYAKLSIPGTHNSAACHTALPSVQCQGASVTDQLNNGVRFLDVRVGRALVKDSEDLVVVHGKFPVKIPFPLKFADTLEEVYNFLANNPSESVVLSIKQEGTGEWDNQNDEFGNCFWDRYVNPNKDRWYLNTSLPTVGEARGKVILFRRFGVQNEQRRQEFGIPASSWSYNSVDDDRGSFCVQDYCEVQNKDDMSKKIDCVKNMINKAVDYNSTHDDKLFLNFTSGSNFFDPSVWPQPCALAMIEGQIDQNFKKGSGIIVLDYAETDNWKLTHELINTNF